MLKTLVSTKPSKLISEHGKAYIIAEVGINHNGDLSVACEHIRQAASAGADAVKFQNWVAEDFISDKTQMFTYKSQGREITESFYELCKRNEIGSDWLLKLQETADEVGVTLLSTPTSKHGVDQLSALGIRVLKNGSDYLSHIPLIKYMAEKADTLILSTGMADQQDIDYAMDAVSSTKSNCEVVLLHCTSIYPTPPEEANLLRMLKLAERYGTPIGYSDHTTGFEAAVQAVTLGACILEKHFTLSHELEGPDHWFSVTPDELSDYVRAVRDAEVRLGRGQIELAHGERGIALEQRLSAVAARPIKAGELLSEACVAYRKPGSGIHPAEIHRFFGRVIKNDVAENQVLRELDFF